jgi:hypothetical protein
MSDIASDMDLIPVDEYLAFTKIARGTAANQRSRGFGPPWCKIGGKIFYSRAGLKAFIKANTVHPKAAKTLTSGRRS